MAAGGRRDADDRGAGCVAPAGPAHAGRSARSAGSPAAGHRARRGAVLRDARPAAVGGIRPASGRMDVVGPAAPAVAGAGVGDALHLPSASHRARRCPLRRRAAAVALDAGAVAAVARGRRAAAGARVPQLRAAGAFRAVQCRTGVAPGGCAPEAPARRGYRLPPDARVPHRRQPATDRLEGHRALAQADLARVPGREEPAAGDADRHRPPDDGARGRAGPFRPRAQCVAGGVVPGAAAGRRRGPVRRRRRQPLGRPAARHGGDRHAAARQLRPAAARGGHRLPGRGYRTESAATPARAGDAGHQRARRGQRGTAGRRAPAAAPAPRPRRAGAGSRGHRPWAGAPAAGSPGHRPGPCRRHPPRSPWHGRPAGSGRGRPACRGSAGAAASARSRAGHRGGRCRRPGRRPAGPPCRGGCWIRRSRRSSGRARAARPRPASWAGRSGARPGPPRAAAGRARSGCAGCS